MNKIITLQIQEPKQRILKSQPILRIDHTDDNCDFDFSDHILLILSKGTLACTSSLEQRGHSTNMTLPPWSLHPVFQIPSDVCAVFPGFPVRSVPSLQLFSIHPFQLIKNASLLWKVQWDYETYSQFLIYVYDVEVWKIHIPTNEEQANWDGETIVGSLRQEGQWESKLM